MPETNPAAQENLYVLPDPEKWELVKRVASSKPFQKSARLRDFLLYVCDRSLTNRSQEVREQHIGSTVFGRSPDYNPSEDNIVRVEARHVRKRLADYFAAEGKDEPWTIEIPKGSYLPVFIRRRPEAAEPAEAGAAETLSPAPARMRIAVAALIVGLALACAFLFWQNQSLRRQRTEPAARAFPWNLLFDAQHQTNVVLADSCLAFLQDVLLQPVTLAEYLNRSYLEKLDKLAGNPALRSALDVISTRQYTSLADVNFVRNVTQIDPALRDRVRVVYARNLNIRDFKSNHTILLGTSRANPFVELFEPKLNFRFGVDTEPLRAYFRNKAPRPGEQNLYVSRATGNSGEGYAVVAFLPNLDRTGHVLIVEGASMEGTEAGWEFLADPAASSKFKGKHFEILLKLRTVGGTSQDTQPVAYRLID